MTILITIAVIEAGCILWLWRKRRCQDDFMTIQSQFIRSKGATIESQAMIMNRLSEKLTHKDRQIKQLVELVKKYKGEL